MEGGEFTRGSAIGACSKLGQLHLELLPSKPASHLPVLCILVGNAGALHDALLFREDPKP